MLKKVLLLPVLFLLASSCGSDPAPTTAAADKNLFSSWAQTNSAFVLDLTQGSFGTFAFTYLITGNGICDCTLSLGGVQSSGNGVISGCIYRTGTGTGTDPGCTSLNASYTYTKTTTILSVCRVSSGVCTTYQ